MRAVLAAEIERLRRVARGVAWVAPENLHITLKFLGPVETDRLGDLAQALARVAQSGSPFTLGVRGLGAFPAPTRPRVIWAGLGDGTPPVAALAASIEDAVAPLGFAPEGRPFAGHVTMGRVREPRRDTALATALEGAARRDFGSVRVERVALMRSDLSPRGARYTELDGWRLGKPEPPGRVVSEH